MGDLQKIKTKPVAISKAKHIWKVYQFHRINDLEIHPHLHSKAENWATPYLQKHAPSYISRFDKQREPTIEEEEEEQDIDLSYADQEGSSPETIMQEASGITQEQANLHKRPNPKELESMEIDEGEEEFPPLPNSPPKTKRTHNDEIIPTQREENKKGNSNADSKKDNSNTDNDTDMDLPEKSEDRNFNQKEE